MEKLIVKNVIISKQIESSENYNEFIKIAKNKNINIILVQAGNTVKIDNETFFYILWPEKEQLLQNVLNNNSIVAKFVYKDFKILFTGDIEAIAEEKIIKKYSKMLQANIIKIAHHGSKTSSTKQFLELVKPQISLIGVGEKNTFGHPSKEVMEKLNNLRN